ncbi:MAG: SDR family oxidoreductase [Halanaerobiales bacterium]
MKVLFIGGTGLISEAVSRLVVEKGIDLYLFNRGNRPEFIPGDAHLIKGNIRDREEAERLLQGHSFDVVVNWIAFTPEHIRTDLELFRGKTDQYIFISSASAYQKPQTDYLITESTPLSNPHWQYSRNKIACEKLLKEEYRENSFPMTIVRPSHTYGKTSIPAALNSSAHPWSLVDRMRRGKKVIVHGDGTSLWMLTHNTDFARAFEGLLGNSKAIGHAFHITSDEVLNWNQITRAIGRAAGVEPEIVHISSDFITEFSPESEGTLIGDKAVSCVFDNSKIKYFVPGYEAVVPFEKGIGESIEWFNADPERRSIDEDWNQLMDKIIDAYEKALP